MASADEAGLIEALIASERIGVWLDDLQYGSTPNRQQSALQQLEQWVLQREAYAEEAQKAGAVRVLTSLLKRTDDEHFQTSAARIIAACSGHAAHPSHERTFDYGPGREVVVCEGSLGDGLGARIWLSAQALARTLVAAPQLVAGKEVLEVGAGCGLVGLLAVRLGASKVVLTDYEAAVLSCLQRSVAATAQLAASSTSSTATAAAQSTAAADEAAAAASNGHAPAASVASATNAANGREHSQAATNIAAGGSMAEAAPAVINLEFDEAFDAEDFDPEDFDPEDADSCDDLDGFLAAAAEPSRTPAAWETGCTAVRRLDWGDAIETLDARPPHQEPAEQLASSYTEPRLLLDGEPDTPTLRGAAGRRSFGGPPDLDAAAQFEVILGSDVVYDGYHVAGLAAALARHLAPGGRALLCCPVREQAVLGAFDEQLRVRRLCCELQPVKPLDTDSGVAGQARSYEGGFQMFVIQHEDDRPFDWPWGAMLGWQQ